MDTKLDVGIEVESLVKRAAHSDKSDDALKFSQAACNSANAMAALTSARIRLRELGEDSRSDYPPLSPYANCSPSA